MSNQCEKLRPAILEHSDGLLPRDRSRQIDLHLSECVSCRAFAAEMRTITQGVAALPYKKTSPDFDARLALRLSEIQSASAAKPAWRRALESVLMGSRPALRPGLALCSVAAALGVAAFFGPQPTHTIVTPQAKTDDSAMLAQCVEQHRSETSAQPLDDWSAQNLSQQLDKAPTAAPSAVSLSEESNF